MSSLDAQGLKVDPERAALMIVDIQERLAAAMPEARVAAAVKGVRALVEMAGRFQIPVVVTQQYPKGLGGTLGEIEAALEPLGDLVRRFDKIDFSACAAPPFSDLWDELERDQWLLTGMESHVCVYQTGRQLIARGAQVFTVVDAVASRTEENRQLGVGLLERCGAVPSSTETIVFDVLGKAEGEGFKALSKLIR